LHFPSSELVFVTPVTKKTVSSPFKGIL
jgi:hypothetical protein